MANKIKVIFKGLYKWIPTLKENTNVVTRDENTQAHLTSKGGYLGFDEATGDYLRTPSNGIIPNTSGVTGNIGTSSWRFNTGYYNYLNIASHIDCNAIYANNVLKRDGWWNNGSGQNVNNDINSIHFAYSNHNCPTNGIIATLTGTHNSYPLQIMGNYTNADMYVRSRNDDGAGWTSWRRVVMANEIADTGWVGCSLGYGISRYSTSQAPVQVRRIGQTVYLRGAVTNTTSWATHDSIITIPEGFRPDFLNVFVCQGSSSNRFLLEVNSNGVCAATRYSNNTTMNNTVSTGSWLNFFCSWLIG